MSPHGMASSSSHVAISGGNPSHELEGERKWQDSPWARAVLKALKRMVNDDSSVLGLGCAAYASGEEARTEWARHWCRVGAWMGGCGE